MVDTFVKDSGMHITIFGLIREPSEDLFSNQKELDKVRTDNESSVLHLVQEAQEILVTGGFPAETIETKTVRIQKGSLAGNIIEEQQRSHYDTIVVGGARMSKTEEFLFGNVAVKLVRESDCPVLTIY
jgi:nucleotide-binding universal stress UspA family protein